MCDESFAARRESANYLDCDKARRPRQLETPGARPRERARSSCKVARCKVARWQLAFDLARAGGSKRSFASFADGAKASVPRATSAAYSGGRRELDFAPGR
jgi:hypothetical protein